MNDSLSFIDRIRNVSGRLAWRILFWMTFVALVPLLIMAYQGYHCARQGVIETQNSLLTLVLETKKNKIEAWLHEVKSDFRFMTLVSCLHQCSGGNNAEKTCSMGESIDLLTRLHRENSYYRLLYAFDRDWDVFISSKLNGVENQTHIPAEFKAALEKNNDFTISQTHLHDDGSMGVFVGHVVKDVKGVKLFLVGDIFLSETIVSIFKSGFCPGKTTSLYLLSPKGNYLSAPAGDNFLIGKQCKIPVEMLDRGETNFSEYTSRNNETVFARSSAIKNLNWITVVEIDKKEALGWLGVLKIRAFATGLITLIVVVFISFRRSQILSKPLRELVNVARKIATGHHSARLNLLSGTEAREVGMAFNRMMDEIEVSHRKILHSASLAAVGELSSSIVHEMRNPLSSIKMNIQALKCKVADDPPFSELAEIAYQQSERLESMLSDLLSYSKPLSLKLAPIEINTLMTTLKDLVRKNLEEKSVSFKIINHLKIHAFTADMEQIIRALTNLVINAIYAVPSKGNITISIRESQEHTDWIEFVVKDNGTGIPEQYLKNIFQPFITSKPEGTGLGLSNVKKIAEYHYGKVSAANLAEGGAVFILALPMKGTDI